MGFYGWIGCDRMERPAEFASLIAAGYVSEARLRGLWGWGLGAVYSILL